MREINLNIEGFNVNGICVACLNYGRKMFYDKQINKCLKLLGNIDVPEDISVQLCWECLAAVRAVDRFQEQINRTFDILLDYSRKHTYLNTPSDLWTLAIQRLSTQNPSAPLTTSDPWECLPVDLKQEVDEKAQEEFMKIGEKEFAQVKSPFDEDSIQDTAQDMHEDAYSSDDNIKLSAVKKEKKPKAESRSKEQKSLKHFPEGTVSIEQVSLETILELREKDRIDPAFVKFKHRCDSCVCTFNSDKLLKHHLKSRHSKISLPEVYQPDNSLPTCNSITDTPTHFSIPEIYLSTIVVLSTTLTAGVDTTATPSSSTTVACTANCSNSALDEGSTLDVRIKCPLPFTFIESRKGGHILLKAGRRYRLNKTNKDASTVWYCTAAGCQRIVKEKPHSCLPDYKAMDVNIAMDKCRKRVRSDSSPIPAIYETEMKALRTEGFVDEIPPFTSIKNQLYQSRNKHMKRKPR